MPKRSEAYHRIVTSLALPLRFIEVVERKPESEGPLATSGRMSKRQLDRAARVSAGCQVFTSGVMQWVVVGSLKGYGNPVEDRGS